MEPIKLNKIVSFFDRRLLLSSFLLLVILGTLLAFYITYAKTGHFFSMGGGIGRVASSAKLSILGIWLCMLLVFPISVLLASFLKGKASHHAQLSFARKFFLGSIPAALIIFLMTIWNVQETPRHYTKEPMYLYSMAIVITCVYGVMFGAFIGWQSKATKLRIIMQSTAINMLMAIYYVVIYLLSHFSL